ncbi:hypothetical protein FHX42_005263 [Saccharopolyspora lacisalsi]|uniref:Uncharacterized protein n=1 Tax=Halosaccharopolyspora lacisalsi TaxID=1000566 RepID=A0A839E5F6_9PSEU|nr:hypothetical protein [Halosaccharopolyspora lacisalsi]
MDYRNDNGTPGSVELVDGQRSKSLLTRAMESLVGVNQGPANVNELLGQALKEAYAQATERTE